MSLTLFISDLHLTETRPDTTAAFLSFLAGPAREASDLWILGDLFEYWAGDDDLEDPFNARMTDAIGELSARGTRTRVIVGNRDFLLGDGFAARSGAAIVAEPFSTRFGDADVILMHGDALCIDDVAYMQFRTMVRNPAWQAQFLAQPLTVRRKIAEDLRQKSEMSKREKQAEIMDVNVDEVCRRLADTGADILIHGHTHLPARHRHALADRDCTRIVLPDWHDRAVWLEWDGARFNDRAARPSA